MLGSKSHSGANEVVRCFNPACGSWSEPGLHFCDSCLTEMCYKRLSVFKMFDSIRRGDVGWDRGSPECAK